MIILTSEAIILPHFALSMITKHFDSKESLLNSKNTTQSIHRLNQNLVYLF